MPSRGSRYGSVSLFGCSSRTVWRLIRHRNDGESLGERFLRMIHSKQNITLDDVTFSKSDPQKRGQAKKGWIRILTPALDALLSKLKLNPTLYVYQMADYLYTSGFGAFLISQIWQGLKS